MERETALPEAQLEVMEVIWDRGGSVMFADLSSELEARGKEWKANTILTLLARLAERGMVSVCKRGRLNEYIARVSREDYQQMQARSLVDRVFGGSTKHLISALVKQEYLTKDDYDELKEFREKGGGEP